MPHPLSNSAAHIRKGVRVLRVIGPFRHSSARRKAVSPDIHLHCHMNYLSLVKPANIADTNLKLGLDYETHIFCRHYEHLSARL